MAQRDITGSAHVSRNASVRELSRLRAQRAARLARDAAAGQRRMLLAGVAFVASVAVAAFGMAGTIALGWVAAPLSALVAVLIWSRFAAIRAQRADEAEKAELQAIRQGAKACVTTPYSASSRVVDASANVDDTPANADVPTGEREQTGVDGRATMEVQTTVEEQAARQVADAEATTAIDAEAVRESVQVERLTWSVMPIPAPTYAMRGRVRGRNIHVDTDLRGIPQVSSAKVPARPVAVSAPAEGAMSTEEAVAFEPVALSLDAVLESRRAQ